MVSGHLVAVLIVVAVLISGIDCQEETQLVVTGGPKLEIKKVCSAKNEKCTLKSKLFRSGSKVKGLGVQNDEPVFLKDEHGQWHKWRYVSGEDQAQIMLEETVFSFENEKSERRSKTLSAPDFKALVEQQEVAIRKDPLKSRLATVIQTAPVTTPVDTSSLRVSYLERRKDRNERKVRFNTQKNEVRFYVPESKKRNGWRRLLPKSALKTEKGPLTNDAIIFEGADLYSVIFSGAKGSRPRREKRSTSGPDVIAWSRAQQLFLYKGGYWFDCLIDMIVPNKAGDFELQLTARTDFDGGTGVYKRSKRPYHQTKAERPKPFRLSRAELMEMCLEKEVVFRDSFDKGESKYFVLTATKIQSAPVDKLFAAYNNVYDDEMEDDADWDTLYEFFVERMMRIGTPEMQDDA